MRKRFSFWGILLMIAVIGTPVYAVDERYTILPEGGPEVVVDKVTLTYDANGGELVQEPAIVEKNTKVVISNVVPTRDGYEFLGWTTNESEAVLYKAGDLLEVNESVTLYAVWNKAITITFDTNGGLIDQTSMTVYENEVYGTLPVPTKENYVFEGWYTGLTDGVKIDELSVVDNTENHSLYAKWKLVEFAINYELNGGVNSVNNPESYTILSNTIVLVSPIRNGYSFSGWYLDSSFKTKVTEIKAGHVGDVTVYAKWSANKYNISFNGNGATSGKMTTLKDLVFNKNYMLTKNAYKKTGYAFIGWNTKADGTGESYNNNAEVQGLLGKNKGTITLYAQWKINEYEIVYNLNGGINSETNPASYKITTSTIKLASPKRTGYSFNGWYTDSKYKTKITEIKKGSTGKKTLYAKWSATSYSITYELNGGKNSSENPSSYKITTSTFTLSNPSRTGYKFEGWYLDKEFTQKVTSIEKGTTGKKTLYAKWLINTYEIVYNLNGGINNETNPASYKITTSTIKLASPKRTGYSFKGWYTDSKYKTKITEIKKGSTGKKTLYAKWSATSYSITYELNGGKNSSKNPSSYKITTSTFTLSNPSRTGYKFEGWYTDSNFTEQVKEITKGTTGKKTLYAKWLINTYEIVYNLNGGINNETNPASYKITTSTIKLASPKRTGYSFKGWYTDSKYKTKITEIKKGSTGKKTLYAKWSATSYSITYELNGGKNSSKNPSSYKITTSTFTLSNPSRTGYKFEGWYLDKEFTQKVTSIEKGTTGKKTLYAKWKATEYEIVYNLNGGINNENNPEFYTISTSTIKLANPTKAGYSFKGWYSDSKFKTKVTEIKKGSTGKKTLYAKWSIKTYNISYQLNGGKNASGNLTQYKVSDSSFVFKNPTRTGYKFEGWYLDSDFAEEITVLESGSYGDKTLYAKWRANKFTLRFYDNNATSGTYIEDMECTYDNNCILPYGTYEKTGFVFGGWNLSADNSGKTYAEAANVKNITSSDGAVVNLYAYWTIEAPSFSLENVRYNNVKLTFTPNGAASGYVIYRSKSATSGFKEIATLTSGNTYSDNSGLSGSTTYYYKVKAYYTNEYGVKVYSNDTNVTRWVTAEKPNFSGRVINTLGNRSYYGYLKIANYGSKTLYIQNFVVVYPYKNASSESGIDSSYGTLSYVGLSAGYQTRFNFKMDYSRIFSSGAHIAFFIKYDDCDYFVSIYEDGSGAYL